MSEKFIKLVQTELTSNTGKKAPERHSSWLNVLEVMVNTPPVVELPKEVAPESPDPRRNHRSKVVKGLPKEAPEDELEAERRRLRENYMVRRAQDYLSEKKYGSQPSQINYNEFC